MSPATWATVGSVLAAAIGAWAVLRNGRRSTKASTTSDFIDDLQVSLAHSDAIRVQDRAEARAERAAQSEEHRAQMAEQRAEAERQRCAAAEAAEQQRAASDAQASRHLAATEELLSSYRSRLDVAVDHIEALHRHIDDRLPPPGPSYPAGLRLR